MIRSLTTGALLKRMEQGKRQSTSMLELANYLVASLWNGRCVSGLKGP